MRFGLFLFMLALFSCKTLPAEQGKNKQPNMIYIMADDLGYCLLYTSAVSTGEKWIGELSNSEIKELVQLG